VAEGTLRSRIGRIGAAASWAGRALAGQLGGRAIPTLAAFYPTHRCNLRCTYCSSLFLSTPELTTGEWLAIVDELADLGCRRVAILGGEPLLRPDLTDLVGRVRDRGMSCVLTSNGILATRQMERLRRLSTLVLSLDSAGPANDEVRGEGARAAVGEAIAAAREARIPVKLNAVLSARTAPELDGLLEFARRHDVGLPVNVMRSGDAGLWRDAASIKASDTKIRRTLLRLAELSRSEPFLLFSATTYRYAAAWGDFSQDRITAAEAVPGDPRLRGAPRCHAGRAYVTINPDGTLHPCALTAGRISGGNAVREGVRAAWRRLGDHECLACYSPCQVEQNLLFSLAPRVVWHFVGRHLGRFA